MLNLAMSEVVLHRAGVVARVREPKAASMAKHVGMHQERQRCSLADPC